MNNDDAKNMLLRKCKLTSSNYGNLANKLQKRKTLFQVILPYYSVIGIINSLIPKYFTMITETQKNLIGFWGIFISITFLVISMQISLAHYPERIDTATKTLNKLKVLISEIQIASTDKLHEINNKYEQITHENPLVRRRYFYASCKEYDRKHNFQNNKTNSEVFRHFSLNEQIFIIATNILETLLYIFIFSSPLFVYVLIFLLS